MNDNAISDLMSFDPLGEAEKLTGESYKTSEGTMALGMGLHFSKRDLLDAALKETDDTRFAGDVELVLRVAMSEGFSAAGIFPFDGRYTETLSNGREYTGGYAHELLFVLFHSDGLLLTLDSYAETRVNSAKLYFSWRPRKDAYEEHEVPIYDAQWKVTGHETKLFPPSPPACSGSWKTIKDEDDWVWTGDKDVREGLRHFLRVMRAQGDFLSPWPARPFSLHVNHYEDWHQSTASDFSTPRQRSQQRIALLPDYVRACIGEAGA